MLKVGDKVKFKNDRNFLSDLESDLLQDLSDRSITGRAFDKIMDSITEGKTFTVAKIEHGKYGVVIGKTSMPYVFEEERFEKVTD